jgi:hypothetical protein
MRIGASLVLIALGAILRFAVTVHNPHGFNYHTAGVILMVVGAIGLVLSLVLLSVRRRTDVIHQGRFGYGDGPGLVGPGTSRTTYLEPRSYDDDPNL